MSHHVLCFILPLCELSTVNKSVTLGNKAKAYNLTALNVDADYMFWIYSITRLGRSEFSSKAAFIRTSSSCNLQLIFIASVYALNIQISYNVKCFSACNQFNVMTNFCPLNHVTLFMLRQMC